MGELTDDERRELEILRENVILYVPAYRYLFTCGCRFDATESMGKEPKCPVHQQPHNGHAKYNFSCGCYFQTQLGILIERCPIHNAKMGVWSMG